MEMNTLNALLLFKFYLICFLVWCLCLKKGVFVEFIYTNTVEPITTYQQTCHIDKNIFVLYQPRKI